MIDPEFIESDPKAGTPRTQTEADRGGGRPPRKTKLKFAGDDGDDGDDDENAEEDEPLEDDDEIADHAFIEAAAAHPDSAAMDANPAEGATAQHSAPKLDDVVWCMVREACSGGFIVKVKGLRYDATNPPFLRTSARLHPRRKVRAQIIFQTKRQVILSQNVLNPRMMHRTAKAGIAAVQNKPFSPEKTEPKSATRFFPCIEEFLDCSTFAEKDYVPKDLIKRVEFKRFTGAMKTRFDTTSSALVILFSHGAAVGCTFEENEPEPATLTESFACAVDSLTFQDSRSAFYSLPDAVVSSASALFHGFRVARQDDEQTHQEFAEYILKWLKGTCQTACLSLYLPASNNFVLAYCEQGKIIGCFDTSTQRFFDGDKTLGEAVSAETLSEQTQNKLEVFVLPAKLALPEATIGVTLSTLMKYS